MKKFILISFLIGLTFVSTVWAQQPQLIKLWETDSILKVPESVLYYKKGNILYVSNIDGKPDEKDSKGSIAKVSLDGKQVNNNWVTGLSAPKGLAIYKKTLYTADVNEVVAIDLKTAAIKQRIPVAGAIFLNDITVDKNGVIYVSDSRSGKVHRIQDGVVSTHLEITGPNGLLFVNNDLYMLARGTLWKVSGDKKMVKIAEEMDPSTDGIELTKSGDFIVSSWAGFVYYVKPDGTKHQLLDTRSQKLNTADIGFDPRTNRVYVPTFWGNKVVAYQLK